MSEKQEDVLRGIVPDDVLDEMDSLKKELSGEPTDVTQKPEVKPEAGTQPAPSPEPDPQPQDEEEQIAAPSEADGNGIIPPVQAPEGDQEIANQVQPTPETTSSETPPEKKPVEKKQPPVVQPSFIVRKNDQDQPGKAPDNSPLAVMEQKYRTLQGKYNSETRRMKELNEQLLTRLTNTEDAVKRLQNPSGTDSGSPNLDELKKQFVESGYEASDFDAFMKLTSPLHTETAQLKTELGQLREQMKTQSDAGFTNDVASQLYADDGIDLRLLIADPMFEEIRNFKDRLSGRTFGEMLKDAEAQHDTERAANLYRDAAEIIIGELSASQHTPQIPSTPLQPENPAPTPATDTTQNPKAQHAMPHKSGASTPQQAGNESRIYPLDWLQGKQEQLMSGRITSEQFQKFEREFAKAVDEGRIKE